MNKLLLAVILGFCSAAFARPLLISLEEMNSSNSAPPPFKPKLLPVKDAPLIELSAPKLSGPVNSPTSIDVKFQPTPPSSVKPNTFKVLYGSFEIDITKRLLSVAKVTEAGVSVQEANLPKGKHKLLMVVEDTAGRQGSKVVEFEVK